jgi:hypothetical protein
MSKQADNKKYSLNMKKLGNKKTFHPFNPAADGNTSHHGQEMK